MATTRSRRSNAGNRLQSLLEDQALLDEEDAKIFAEKEDDEDFDIEAEEERIRQERLAAAKALEEASDEEKEKDGEEGSGDDKSGEDDNISLNDENFSDTTDDSELENDEEPVDAGEKELIKENRQKTREKRIAERNKMFKIKIRPPAQTADGVNPPKPKKKKIFTSADSMSETRRSERKSAMRNKQHLIEQMKEAEERRAQYVPPKRTSIPKLTQEQRLEEAKKTEIRNLSTLNKFVELEEERKIQQRLAMLSRRPKLTHFVRFHSAQYLSQPRLIVEVTEEEAEEHRSGIVKEETPGDTSAAMQKPDEQATTHESGTKTSDNQGTTETSRQDGVSEQEPSEKMAVKVEGAKEDIKASNESTDNKSQNEKESTSQNTVTASTDTKPQADEPSKTSQEKKRSRDSSEQPETNDQERIKEEENVKPDKDNVKTDDESKATLIEVKSEIEDSKDGLKQEIEGATGTVIEKPEEPIVEGPAHSKSYNFLTLHDFHDVHSNRFSIRSIILGPVASTVTQPPAKRMCPFSGTTAKYLDPTTGVAYSGLDTCKLIKLAGENQSGWNKELGGVFTTAAVPQRPAKGVPEGF